MSASSATSIPLDLYADHVINVDQSPVNRSSLEGKTIGLYFSAHWCAPCREFTPLLAERYAAILAANRAFEIVFVSADKSEEDALAYFAEMPWKMLAFAEREIEASLREALQIHGIPCLVFVAKDGRVVTDLAGIFLMNAELENIATAFDETEQVPRLVADLTTSPWTAREYLSSLRIVDTQGEVVPAQELRNKRLLGVFFAATWSAESKAFTTLFAEKYRSFLAENASFEVVFVSWDRDPGADVEYFKSTMPWKMLDAQDRIAKLAFEEVFFLMTPPKLVLFSDNEILTEDGDKAILESQTFEDLFSFPERQRAAKGRELAEFPSLPETITIAVHEHALAKKESVYGGKYRCNICSRDGSGCAYHCSPCWFDAHIDCALKAVIETDVSNE